ncbi:MAG: diguanylate cyclase [Acidovorax sp.]|uniref:GGDEF domain-containing protein n=1 Tax=Acidovorax sp. TaxID=1872122 RepID=UPI00391BCBE5
MSVVYFVVIVAAASLAAGLMGMVINPLIFGGTAADGLLIWFTSELVDYLVILPVILTMPRWRLPPRNQRRRELRSINWLLVAPVLTLLLGGLLGLVISGPGAISYLVPGLLWCALVYSLFVTAVLTLLCSVWTLMAVSVGYLHLGSDFDARHALQSFRIGVALMVLAPLAVASVMAARNELLSQLQHAASHDRLTGVLNRAGFMDRAEGLLHGATGRDRPFVALMLDIDHFKRVNDLHGHAAGDQVLAGFAQLASRCLRDSDVIGRLGGEEFAVLLPDATPAAAQAVAQRICDACATQVTSLLDGTQLVTTVSIGTAHAPSMPVSLEALLSAADEALYRAKQAGRNQVVMGNLVPAVVM